MFHAETGFAEGKDFVILLCSQKRPEGRPDFKIYLNDRRHMAWHGEREGFPGILCWFGVCSEARPCCVQKSELDCKVLEWSPSSCFMWTRREVSYFSSGADAKVFWQTEQTVNRRGENSGRANITKEGAQNLTTLHSKSDYVLICFPLSENPAFDKGLEEQKILKAEKKKNKAEREKHILPN